MAEIAKKRIGKLKIGLVLSVIVIVVLAGLSIWLYMNKTSLESQLKERWDSWGSELYWHNYYQNLANQLSTENDALRSERDSLKAPKLVTVNLQAQDVHSGTWHLHVWGTVLNVGTDTGYNCKIHVITYQGLVELHNTYIVLGTIAGESWKWVDENLYYTGGNALTSWTLTLEWTTT